MGMREVVQGTCGWSDPSLASCGRFYPRRGMGAAERLAVYSRKGLFGCVEVDSSNYAIPKVESVANWVGATPPGFVFHFKAFGFLVNGCTAYQALPVDVRERLAGHPPSKLVTLSQVGIEQERMLWERFHRSLEPAIAAGKMGAVVFQFQLSVVPSAEARAHVEHCARQLRPDLSMAVEFRNRLWVSTERVADTLTWLGSLRAPRGVSLVSCDDLASEVYSARELREQFTDLKDDHLPIVLSARPCADFAYVRLHRRLGCERMLRPEEIEAWADRLAALFTSVHHTDAREVALRGPVYFLWGTDYEDQPMLNAQRLAAQLPRSIAPTWAERVRTTDPHSILTSFSRARARMAESDAAVEDPIDLTDATTTVHRAAAETPPSRSPARTPAAKKRGLVAADPSAQTITAFFRPTKR